MKYEESESTKCSTSPTTSDHCISLVRIMSARMLDYDSTELMLSKLRLSVSGSTCSIVNIRQRIRLTKTQFRHLEWCLVRKDNRRALPMQCSMNTIHNRVITLRKTVSYQIEIPLTAMACGFCANIGNNSKNYDCLERTMAKFRHSS